MSELHFPWLELAVCVPLAGALLARWSRDPDRARRIAVWAGGLSLVMALAAWLDFRTIGVWEAGDPHLIQRVWPLRGWMEIDELSGPLLPLTALVFFLTYATTLRTKVRRFPFAFNLFQQFLMLALLTCHDPWGIVVLLVLQSLPVYLELRARSGGGRAFLIHMLLFAGLLAGGWALIDPALGRSGQSPVAIGMVAVALLLRSGCLGLTGWMTLLFEKASLGTAVLFTTPLPAAWAMIHLVIPHCPDWSLRVIALASLLTAVVAAGLAVVQTELRRFFCFLLLANASLVLTGMETATPAGLAGALWAWLGVFVTFAGFGLTIRAIESRVGRLSLQGFHGLYAQMPLLAAFFLVTGLASAGFPGTAGFVGLELLIEGTVAVFPVAGLAMALVAALNGIAILRTYFRLFGGEPHTSTFSMQARWPERLGVLVLTFLIIGPGLVPQPGVESRYHAAREVLSRREPGPSGDGLHLAVAPLEPPISNGAED